MNYNISIFVPDIFYEINWKANIIIIKKTDEYSKISSIIVIKIILYIFFFKLLKTH